MTTLRHRLPLGALAACGLGLALASGCGGDGGATTAGAAGSGPGGGGGGAEGGNAGAAAGGSSGGNAGGNSGMSGGGVAGAAGGGADAGTPAGGGGNPGAAGSAPVGAGGNAGAGAGSAGTSGGAAGGRGGSAGAAGGRGGSAGATGGRGGSAGSAGAAGAAGGGRGGGAGGRGGATAGAGGTAGAAGTSAAGTGGGGGAPPAITIWVAGDSTVADGSAPCPIGWGASFQSLFTSRATVVNDAIAGRSVRTWLYSVQSTMDSTGECVLDMNPDGTPVLQSRWQTMLSAGGMKAGDYLLIQFGINDSDSTCPRHVGINAFKSSYGMMAQAATDRGAHPIFITPTSSISCSGTTAVATRGAFVPATKDAGTQYGVPVIDLNAATVALYNAMSFCPVPGGDVSASTTGPVGDFFCDDHTHFSATGAPQIAALVAQAIRNQSLPLAAYLK